MKSKREPFLNKGTKILIGKDSTCKGTIAGHTIQDRIGRIHRDQLFYLVQLDEPATIASVGQMEFPIVLVHPDNLTTVVEANRKLKSAIDLDSVYNFGQSDGSGFQIKTNAPASHVELTRYEIQKRGKLSPRKLCRRLKKKGFRAKEVR